MGGETRTTLGLDFCYTKYLFLIRKFLSRSESFTSHRYLHRTEALLLLAKMIVDYLYIPPQEVTVNHEVPLD